MRFIVLLIPFFALFSMEFYYEQDFIYLLQKDEFSVKNGDLRVNISILDKQDFTKEILKTKHSTTILDSNLNFYHYAKHYKNHNNLMRLRKRGNSYFTRINHQFINQNCYIVLKNITQKTILAKSNAIVLDLDDKEIFQIAKNPNAYFGCFDDDKGKL